MQSHADLAQRGKELLRVGDVHLSVDVGHVVLEGVSADAELVRDARPREPSYQKTYNFPLSMREGKGRCDRVDAGVHHGAANPVGVRQREPVAQMLVDLVERAYLFIGEIASLLRAHERYGAVDNVVGGDAGDCRVEDSHPAFPLCMDSGAFDNFGVHQVCGAKRCRLPLVVEPGKIIDFAVAVRVERQQLLIRVVAQVVECASDQISLIVETREGMIERDDFPQVIAAREEKVVYRLAINLEDKAVRLCSGVVELRIDPHLLIHVSSSERRFLPEPKSNPCA